MSLPATLKALTKRNSFFDLIFQALSYVFIVNPTYIAILILAIAYVLTSCSE